MYSTKISVLFIIFCIVLLLNNNSYGQLTINIDADNSERLSEIFSESVTGLNQLHPFTSKSAILCIQLKKFSLSVLQMIGIMFSLVGANLITSYFDSNTVYHTDMEPIIVEPVIVDSNNHQVKFTNPIVNPDVSETKLKQKNEKKCDGDYGC